MEVGARQPAQPQYAHHLQAEEHDQQPTNLHEQRSALHREESEGARASPQQGEDQGKAGDEAQPVPQQRAAASACGAD